MRYAQGTPFTVQLCIVEDLLSTRDGDTTMTDSAGSSGSGFGAQRVAHQAAAALDRGACSHARAMRQGLQAARRLEGLGDSMVGLAPEERAMLYQDARAGAEAAVSFFLMFEPAALEFVERYRDRFSIDDQDLIAACRNGLTVAMWQYDPEPGFGFGTYAKWWMRTWAVAIASTAVLDALGDRAFVQAKVRQLELTRQSLEEAWGRPPSAEELSIELKVTPAQVVALSKRLHDMKRGYDSHLALDASLWNPLKDYLH